MAKTMNSSFVRVLGEQALNVELLNELLKRFNLKVTGINGLQAYEHNTIAEDAYTFTIGIRCKRIMPNGGYFG